MAPAHGHGWTRETRQGGREDGAHGSSHGWREREREDGEGDGEESYHATFEKYTVEDLEGVVGWRRDAVRLDAVQDWAHGRREARD